VDPVKKRRKTETRELYPIRSRRKTAKHTRPSAEDPHDEAAAAGGEEFRPDLVCRYALDGTILFVNEAFCRHFQRTNEELVGEDFFRIMHDHAPDSSDRRIASLRCLDRNVAAAPVCEVRVVDAEGRVARQQWMDLAVFDEKGVVVGFQSVGRDITEERTCEGCFSREEVFQALADNLREVFWVRSREKILYVGPVYEEIWGRSRESLYEDPSSFLGSVHPDDRERVLERFMFENQEAEMNLEFRIIRTDGSIRWIHTRSVLLTGGDEEDRTVGIAADITERKNAETLLRLQRDLAVAVGSATETIEGLNCVLDVALQMEGIDSGGIYLVDGKTGEFRLASHKGLSPRFVECASRYDSTTPEAQLAMRGEPSYWPSESAVLDSCGPAIEEEKLTAVAMIPVRCEGNVIALLNVGSHTRPGIPAATRSALETIAAYTGSIVARMMAQEALRHNSELLQETVTALKVLLRQRDEEKAEFEEGILNNLKLLVYPYLNRLKSGRLSPDQAECLLHLESRLEGITSQFVGRLSKANPDLTPTEIKVADLIRDGRTSKEIATLLNLSEGTIMFHRENIRKKLDLQHTRVNLASYLRSLG